MGVTMVIVGQMTKCKCKCKNDRSFVSNNVPNVVIWVNVKFQWLMAWLGLESPSTGGLPSILVSSSRSENMFDFQGQITLSVSANDGYFVERMSGKKLLLIWL